ncbi:hypothetical protein [Legionella spiritensis]|uniref:Uncharacterized protein n=1 Tax=Legionella spiritensis TaxID=452 RepID=A0A0W0Z6L3_LEGSP|nr:hypothetical protein [Legionella spiritensis]KTD64358.1 hypothetical protein Lspi_1165 [Legionella spiritensis]SNV46342.1 Uncharacterised protein [Legionella spiritensis]VEG91077.1 Uncharacterised protein [Legionella spiritensis]
MSDESENSSFIKNIDRETHDSIMHLHQKLTGIQDEIDVKIKTLADESDNPENQGRKQRLLALSNEIQKALASINKLVSLAGDKESRPEGFEQVEHADLVAFRDMINDSANQIDEIKDKL